MDPRIENVLLRFRISIGPFLRKRGIALRISEAYEHEPLLSCQVEENCPAGGCSKTGTQCVDIAAPLVLAPAASVGTVTVTCQGSPCITCVTEADGSRCVVTMTQQICVSVPVRYGVTLTAGEPTISCADGSCGCC